MPLFPPLAGQVLPLVPPIHPSSDVERLPGSLDLNLDPESKGNPNWHLLMSARRKAQLKVRVVEPEQDGHWNRLDFYSIIVGK